MADCNDLFKNFLGKITVPSAKTDNLQRGRNAIKERIESHFSKVLAAKKPSFYLQGSYALKTMVQPLGQEDYDLDDGVYLEHTDDDISTPTPQTVSNWIVKAVEYHTKKKPINKKNCVRVVYEEGYHIDLPVYRNIRGIIHLGTLEGDKWVPSDAKKFNNWFYERLDKTEQMRSCIKYLKAWKDVNDCDLKGIHITVLVGDESNHIEVDGRDDMSLANTVDQIIEYLKDKRAIYNPIDKSENFIESWSKGKLDSTIKSLEEFREKTQEALAEDDKEQASKIWRELFGKRFPLHKAEDSKKKEAVVVATTIVERPKPSIIVERPKPWR